MLMPSMVLPAAEWISSTPRQASVPDAGAYGASSDSPPSSVSPQPAAGIAGPSSSESQHVDVHRGSGGLVRGRAVFCLPPDALWFQGHFAYAARGGCTASLGVLGTELPVDPCMQCCHGGFSRHKLAFIHHESGKESTLVVERYGGNMMSLHAEASGEGDGGAAGDGPMAVDSDLSFQTHVMKADDDARPLLDRYFQSIVRAATDPAELQECIVCIGQMDVPLSLLQELAAPLPDVSRSNSMVCSAFSPCREMPQLRPRRAASKPTPALSPYPPESTASSRHARVASSPSRSVTSRTEDSEGGEAIRPGVHREGEAASGGGEGGGEGGDVSGRSATVEGGAVAGGGGGEGEAVQEEDDDWL